MAAELRRSSRSGSNDSNGREYLANRMAWSGRQLEGWIKSSTVRPHLQLWHYICIGSPRRFNDAVDWINTGDNGYFYDPERLENDLLLMCLDAEDTEAIVLGTNTKSYANPKANTSDWITQDLWARTAWRIVQYNKSLGQAFENHHETDAPRCYGFTIDLLCLAFHSIAYRGVASIYTYLINGEKVVPKPSKLITIQTAAGSDDGPLPSSPGSEGSTNELIVDGSRLTPEHENEDVIHSSPITSVGSEDGGEKVDQGHSKKDSRRTISTKHTGPTKLSSTPENHLNGGACPKDSSKASVENLCLLDVRMVMQSPDICGHSD